MHQHHGEGSHISANLPIPVSKINYQPGSHFRLCEQKQAFFPEALDPSLRGTELCVLRGFYHQPIIGERKVVACGEQQERISRQADGPTVHLSKKSRAALRSEEFSPHTCLSLSSHLPTPATLRKATATLHKTASNPVSLRIPSAYTEGQSWVCPGVSQVKHDVPNTLKSDPKPQLLRLVSPRASHY